MITDSVRHNSFPWVLFAIVSLPFVVLVWLLVTSVSANLDRYQRLQDTVGIFVAGEALLYPLEDVAVYSPVHILINHPEINPLFNKAYDRVPAALVRYTESLRSTHDSSSRDYAAVIQTDWASLNLTTSNSATLGPYDEVQRLTERVYRSLGSLLYLLEFNAGKQVGASELLMLTADDLQSVRASASELHALSLFVSVRGGYLGSTDAQRLEASWSVFDGELQALSKRLGSIRARNSDPASAQRLADLQKQLLSYRSFIDNEYLLADVIEVPWTEANERGVAARAVLHRLSSEFLGLANQSVQAARNKKIVRDALLSLGLVTLYLVVSGIGLLFYRSRETMMHALAESRTKSQVLARMSHEIRTPLNGVIGLAELLHETNPDARQREYIGLIDSAGRALVNLVNDILDYAKIEAGKFQLDIAGFNVRNLVNDTCQIFSLQVNDNRCLLLCMVADDVPARVRGDSTRIRQVLINLIGNAVKFTRDGWIEVRVTCRGEDEDGLQLRFEVQDSGIGLSPDEQRHLFGMFNQASAGVATRFGGTGLGLSISRELVRLMGGDIDVSSARNWGSTFWFDLTLPLADKDASVALNDVVLGGSALGDVIAVEDSADVVGNVVTERVLLLDSSGQLARMTAAGGAALAQVKVVSTTDAALEALFSGEPFKMAVIYADPTSTDSAAIVNGQVAALAAGDIPIKVVTGVRGDLAASWVPDDVVGTSLVTRSVFSLEQLVELFQVVQVDDSVKENTLEAERLTLSAEYSELRVLVAEDNPVNQIVTRGYLCRLGIEPDIAEDGREAVQCYRDKKGQYDLILMDLDMPLLDGPSATRQIRALEHSNGWSRTRIVALSAHALPEYREQVVDAGMDGQLVKPVTLQQLSAALVEPAV
jgi:signal transduction histidine kinase/CheY-like chemotaxis protein